MSTLFPSPHASSLRPVNATSPAPLAVAAALADTLALSAAARDHAGGHAAAERQLIRESGLLALSVPAAWGGGGARWPEIYAVIRRIAQADSALAHVLAFHHLQLATVQIYGQPEQAERLHRATLEHGWFWGNALNPLDQRLQATEAPGGWVLNGVKSYCSGSVGADRLVVSAWHAPSASLLIGELPTDAPGLRVQQDWNAFGQRQTDSGTVHFHHVELPADQVLLAPGRTPPLATTLRAQIAQLILANLYTGIARGAYEEALRFVREQARPWFASGVAEAGDDPHVQHRFGQLRVQLRPAEVLTDLAAQQLQAGLDRGAALTRVERDAVAVAVAEAKVVAHQASLAISSQFFELTGARATAQPLGLDRFWRNARVHTLHDPVDYKLRDLGRHALTGQGPEPSPYS